MTSRFSHAEIRRRAFSLVEVMVAVAVLALLVALLSQLFNSATTIATQSNKHMDADAQARTVFDRMAIDFGQMLKRPDVDYFLKDANSANRQTGNDICAFFSQVPGYSASAVSQQSPISLVGYRTNVDSASPFFNQMERLGYGLVWNGVEATGSDKQMVFTGSSTSFNNTITSSTSNWPKVANGQVDPAYEEIIGPEVFRMEYYYLLRGQTFVNGTVTTTFAAELSDVPWDMRIKNISGIAPHTSVNGLQDVAAISVVIAVMDPRSRTLASGAQLQKLASTLIDFPSTDNNGINSTKPGYLESQWRKTIDSTSGLPRIVTSAIRVYRRDFYLPQK